MQHMTDACLQTAMSKWTHISWLDVDEQTYGTFRLELLTCPGLQSVLKIKCYAKEGYRLFREKFSREIYFVDEITGFHFSFVCSPLPRNTELRKFKLSRI